MDDKLNKVVLSKILKITDEVKEEHDHLKKQLKSKNIRTVFREDLVLKGEVSDDVFKTKKFRAHHIGTVIYPRLFRQTLLDMLSKEIVMRDPLAQTEMVHSIIMEQMRQAAKELDL